MAKAATRIKTGKGEYIEVGGAVPADIAKDSPHVVDQSDFKPKIDPKNPKSYAGEDAARESILMRPDNPNRPGGAEGEASFKVVKGGDLGRGPATPPAKGDGAKGDGAKGDGAKDK